MKTSFAIGLAAFGGIWCSVRAETLTVASDETKNLTAQETYAAEEIHGVLNVTGTKSAWGGIVNNPASAPCSVGTGAGDRAAVSIGDYGRIQGGLFTFGGADGRGTITIGGKRPGDATDTPWDGAKTHLSVCGLTLATNATSDTGVIDILTLNAGAAAGLNQNCSRQRIVNASSQADLRILFNGGYFALFNAFSGSYLFTTQHNTVNPNDVPAGKGGCAIVLESQNGNPIDLRFVNGSTYWPVYGTVNFRGAGDVSLYAKGSPDWAYGWNWNQHGTSWQQNGDLCLSGDFRLTCQTTDALPYAATNGIVRLEGNKYCFLDLKGYSQKLNGLVVKGECSLTNSSQTAAVLTLGSAKPDAVLAVSRAGGTGLVTARFTGAGTLSVSNTPAFPALDIHSGTLRVTGNCGVGRLTLQKGVRVVVDGGTFAVTESYTDKGAVVTSENGGRLNVVLDCPADRNSAFEAAETISTQLDKTGAGRLTLYSAGKIGADVHVAAGAVGFAVFGTTNHWLRFSFTKMVDDRNFEFSEMRLLDRSGNRVDGGGSVKSISEGVGAGTEGSAVGNADATCEPQDMPPRTIWASDQGWTYAEPAGGYRQRSPSALFDGQTWTYLLYKTSCSASSPKVFVIRLPSAATDMYSYTFRNGYSGARHPSAWTVETSPDGLAWTVCDEQVNQSPSSESCKFYNDGTPFPIYAGSTGAAGLVAGANVRVDRGATFDASAVAGGQSLDRLTVDCATGTGDGTFRNVRLAATGTIDLMNILKGSLIPLPLAFVDSVTTGSLDGWSVRLNGVAKPGYRLVWLDGRLAVCGSGMRLIVR